MSGTKVISYSFFRSPASRFEKPEAGAYQGKFYAAHFPAVIKACRANFPHWEIRVHHDESLADTPEELYLLQQGVRLIRVGDMRPLCEMMLWRMRPIWDETVDVVICRDLDSIVSPRERRLVDQWLESGMAVHAIHDNPGHTGTPLMGGMCGYLPGQVRDLTGIRSLTDLVQGADLGAHGSDQRLLNQRLWPKVQNHTLMHQLHATKGEGAGKTIFEAPPRSQSPEPWQRGSLGEKADECPHVGAVFTEYEGKQYMGPTYEAKLIESRLTKVNALYDEVLSHMSNQPAKAEVSSYAAFSSDLNRDYAFYLPLTVRMWREVVGYGSFITLVGSEMQRWISGCFGVAYEEARKEGAKLVGLRSLEGHRDSTVAQVARLYQGVEFKDSDYILTTDTDMFPMSREFFRSADRSKPVQILYANAYQRQVNGRTVPDHKYPICYLGAEAHVWRKIMRIDGRPIREQIAWQLDNGLGRGAGHDAAWNYDELLFGVRFHESPYAAKAQYRSRNGAPPRDRIDRSGWSQGPRPENASDAHLLRPAQHPDNWPRVRELIRAKLGEDSARWADDYRDRFVAAGGL